jgi:hypothetical protein
MGLDNMPHDYPCTSGGTAVMETITMRDGSTDERIDCEATIKVGGCPFTNANPPEKGRVMGMMGTHCWYRGKYGNWLVDGLGIPPESDDNFYGTDEDGTYRPPEACLSLADRMESALDERGGKMTLPYQETTDEVLYAIWYLRWVAEHCDGMDAWY